MEYHFGIKAPLILLRDDGVRAFDSIPEVLRSIELPDIEGWPTIGVDSLGVGIRLTVEDNLPRLRPDETVWRELMTSEIVEDQLIEFFTVSHPELGLVESQLKLWSAKNLIQRVFEVIAAKAKRGPR